MGAVTLGWELTNWALVIVAPALDPVDWRRLTAAVAVAVRYVIDSTFSVVTGFWCNAASPPRTRQRHMIGFATIGTNDMPRALVFHDALSAVIGAKRMADNDRFKSWGITPGAPMVALVIPYDLQPATAGNGNMIALKLETRAQVEAMHAKALALGGADEGAIGLRGETFYAGYFRDLDGNKFCAFTRGQ